MNITTPTYDQMIENLNTMMTEFNAAMDEEDRIKPADVLKAIRKTGVIKAESLAKMTVDKLKACGLPEAYAEQFVDTYGKKAETPVSQPSAPQQPPQIMTAEYIATLPGPELIKIYDPDNSDNAVGERLLTLSKGQGFLIFTKDGAVNWEASTTLFKELRAGHLPRDIYEGNNVFPVGRKPGESLDENPLFPKETLRPDGTCDHTQMKWTCPKNLRLIAHLAVNVTRELSTMTEKDTKDIIIMAHEDKGTRLIAYCPKAVRKLADLEDEGAVPTLKIKQEAAVQNAGFGNNDPFNSKPSKHVRY